MKSDAACFPCICSAKGASESGCPQKEEFVLHVEAVITRLRDAYREVAAQDESTPVMENSQEIYAGLTYGRDSLTENMAYESTNRGFRA